MDNKDLPENQRDNCEGVNLEKTSLKDSTLHEAAETSLPRLGDQDAGITDYFNPMPEWLSTLMAEYDAKVGSSKTPVQQQRSSVGSSTTPVQQQRSSMLHAQQDYLSDDSSGSDDQVQVPVKDNIEYFFSSSDDDVNIGMISGCSTKLQSRTARYKRSAPEGFALEEVRSLSPCNEELLCCQYSENGEFLASAGHGKEVFIWETRCFQLLHRVEQHSDVITDLRFQPESAVLATSSLDTTVKLWDLNNPSAPSLELKGHVEGVNSIDFHPKVGQLLCSCDNFDQMLVWDSNCSTIEKAFEGGCRQVRFQPREGKFLAAASGNKVNIFDVEHERLSNCLEGHVKEIHSICWDRSGSYLASVSDDSARIWAVMTDMSCVHVLRARRNKFRSCSFYPGCYLTLAIGTFKTIELWTPQLKTNKTLSILAHDGFVAALARSRRRDRMASAGSDGIVKVWEYRSSISSTPSVP